MHAITLAEDFLVLSVVHHLSLETALQKFQSHQEPQKIIRKDDVMPSNSCYLRGRYHQFLLMAAQLYIA
jgi:hypothetical protein